MSTSSSFEIPQKSIFTVEETCDVVGVRPYVLRFWETEFPEIGSVYSELGKKFYEYRDVEIIFLIKKMLFDEKLTIERAKLKLKDQLDIQHEDEEVIAAANSNEDLNKIQHSLQSAKMKIEQLMQKTHQLRENLKLV